MIIQRVSYLWMIGPHWRVVSPFAGPLGLPPRVAELDEMKVSLCGTICNLENGVCMTIVDVFAIDVLITACTRFAADAHQVLAVVILLEKIHETRFVLVINCISSPPNLILIVLRVVRGGLDAFVHAPLLTVQFK